MNDYLKTLDPITEITAEADAIDIKKAEGTQSLREFVVGFVGYQPGWITFLYRVRQMIVPLLGLKQEGVPRALAFTPEDLPMEPGQMAGFFKVEAAAEDAYWIASARDDHLTAYLGIVRQPLSADRSRFYVVTAVHYHNWAGPVYYTLIRPFHHIVVGRMTRAGVTYQPQPA